MSKQEYLTRIETTYCSGLDLNDATERRCGRYERDTSQEAYNAVDYWAQEENTYEVYEFCTTVTVKKVEPPYSPRTNS